MRKRESINANIKTYMEKWHPNLVINQRLNVLAVEMIELSVLEERTSLTGAFSGDLYNINISLSSLE